MYKTSLYVQKIYSAYNFTIHVLLHQTCRRELCVITYEKIKLNPGEGP